MNGKRAMSSMLLVMAAIAGTEILLALDSIPAIFGLSQNVSIVFTATAFSLLGLPASCTSSPRGSTSTASSAEDGALPVLAHGLGRSTGVHLALSCSAADLDVTTITAAMSRGGNID